MRALALIVLSWSLTAAAFELRTDSQGDVVKWQRSLTFVVDRELADKLHEPLALSAVQAAIAELDEATPEVAVTMRAGEVEGPGYDLEAPSENQNEIMALEDWPYTDGALASTVVTVNARTNEILDTDIVFNVEQHTFRVLSQAMPSSMDVDDVQNTLTHEIGHALGLMHNPVDEQVVMFPRASAGEVGKRVLHDDDRLGLAALYASAPTPIPVTQPQVGCSATGSGLVWPIGLAFLVFLATWRRPTPVRVVAKRVQRAPWLPVLAIGLIGAVANAQPVSPVGVVVVKAKAAHRSATQKKLIVTTFTVELESCATTVCDRVMEVTMPGGRVGDLEMYVEHHPLPALGEHLGLAKKNGRFVVYRLVVPEEAVRFNAVLVRSAEPQTAPAEPAAVVQPVGVVK